MSLASVVFIKDELIKGKYFITDKQKKTRAFLEPGS